MSGLPPPSRQVLEVESSADRSARLGALFSSISSPPTSSAAQPGPSRPSPLPTLPQPREPIGPLPPSDALARARAFLPAFKADTEALLKRAQEEPEAVGIELDEDEDEVEDGDEDEDEEDDEEEDVGRPRVVEFDLGLGVFDVQGDPASLEGPVVDLDSPPSRTTKGKKRQQHDELVLVKEETPASDEDAAGSDTNSESQSDPESDSASQASSTSSPAPAKPP